jgi:hypothetical protein
LLTLPSRLSCHTTLQDKKSSQGGLKISAPFSCPTCRKYATLGPNLSLRGPEHVGGRRRFRS